ncbi:MAG: DUF5906 domain-containing protein [Eubacteriales bacterium]|nr:DUF5906 domain-containing protein [Eubacteriales bacterium]
MKKKKVLPADAPVWITEELKISEPLYCAMFLEKHPMRFIGGSFFNEDGTVTDEALLKQEIFADISGWVDTKVANKVKDIWNALQMIAAAKEIPIHRDRIHVANGTLYLNGLFKEEKQYCRNRLPVNYNPDAPKPVKWLDFLHQLLEEDDILTLQEYLGYCLIPITKAQKMMMIIGRGGEGKSRIGIVMNGILGNAMNTTSIQKVENDKFARADQGNKLLMVDDDMDMNALQKTNYIKSIVTSEGKMDVEKKHAQSYQDQLYVRFLCFGNGVLTALHDRSDGFFRRQIILTTKDRPADRVDDPYLVEKLLEEKEGIFLWCLEGLKRLIANDYHFTISEGAAANIAAAVKEANNIFDFLASEGYIEFVVEVESSTAELYKVYHTWCDDNAENAFTMKSFANNLAQNAERYQLMPTNNIRVGKGKRCRGYKGIQICDPDNPFL